MTYPKIDSHWVLSGDTAQQLLFEQGYVVALTRKIHDQVWALMVGPPGKAGG